MAVPQGLGQLSCKVFKSNSICLEELFQAFQEEAFGKPEAFACHVAKEGVEVLNCILYVISLPEVSALARLLEQVHFDQGIQSSSILQGLHPCIFAVIHGLSYLLQGVGKGQKLGYSLSINVNMYQLKTCRAEVQENFDHN